ncbi:glycosyltransferase [Persicobacter psychrovividus]|uniref:Glycosyl transferase n=1 Tax=Persicobacter psychrovividus TaxID=387638 RepID=A0ABM7VDJ1_9BACT|nr:glycosyl transferase [Persicobacter psychrovividus]
MEILSNVLIFYFGFNALYWFLFSFSGKFYRPRKVEAVPQGKAFNKIAVLIPAYKEDEVIASVVRGNLAQDYPTEFFEIVVIADGFRSDTLEDLKQYPVRVIEVNFEQSTKVKALNFAIEAIGDQYDLAMILDADNIMEKSCLSRMNALFVDQELRAVQGQRMAKNDNNDMAVLDGLSEAINNHIYRSGHLALGFSCPLIGSGMAFRYRMVKRILSQMASVGGFDRELELRLLREGVKVLYDTKAITYDEKVQNSNNFYNQRRRWISTQFVYLRKYFVEAILLLFRDGNLSFFDNAVVRNSQLPRLLFLGFMFLFTALSAFVPYFGSFQAWAAIVGLTVLSVILAIPKSMMNRKLIFAMALLPKTFFLMLKALFSVKGANKKFIHTTHSSNDVK